MGDWLERMPFASLIAFILVMTGSSVMCGTNFEAFKRLDSFFEDRFYPLSEPQFFQTLGILTCILTMLLSIVNTVVGTIATGVNRTKVYSDKYCISCGRYFSQCLLIITYFVTFVWLVLFVALAVPVTLWTMIHTVCREETTYWRSINSDKDEREFSYTFNLTHYGLYRRPLDTSLWSEYVNSPSAFTHLCQQVSTIGPLFASSLLASLIVILGLNTFVACLSTASVRLKYFNELDRYCKLVNSSPRTGPTSLDEYVLQPLMQQTQPSRHMVSGSQSNTMCYPQPCTGLILTSTHSITQPSLYPLTIADQLYQTQQFYSYKPSRHSTYSHRTDGGQ